MIGFDADDTLWQNEQFIRLTEQRFADLLTDVPSDERASIAFHRRFVAEEVTRWRPIIEAAGAYAD